MERGGKYSVQHEGRIKLHQEATVAPESNTKQQEESTDLPSDAVAGVGRTYATVIQERQTWQEDSTGLRPLPPNRSRRQRGRSITAVEEGDSFESTPLIVRSRTLSGHERSEVRSNEAGMGIRELRDDTTMMGELQEVETDLTTDGDTTADTMMPEEMPKIRKSLRAKQTPRYLDAYHLG